MELRRRLNPKYVFIGLYILAFLVYVIYGLQPADAVDSYDVSGNIRIPSIGLNSDVTTIGLEHGELRTPDTIVGSYSRNPNKTLLIGHASTVFENLHDIRLGDKVGFNGEEYTVKSINLSVKEDIDMLELLSNSPKDTIVLMTCAGDTLEGGDATFRLIVTASV
ncbi:class F sortase [Candidatus Saccharibacteria bacterium]|nr:class F sortase [Candidatus Saccharibacteria bacterium]